MGCVCVGGGCLCVQCWGGKGRMVTGTLWGLGTGTPSTEDVRQWLHSLGHANRGGDGCNPLGTLQQWARPFGTPAVVTNCQGLRWGHPPGDLDLGTHSKAGSGGIHQGTRWEGFSVCVPLDTLWGHASHGGCVAGLAVGAPLWGTHWQWVHHLGDKLAVSAPPRGHVAGLAVGAPPGDAQHPTGCPLLPIAAHKEPRVPVPRQHPLAAAEAFNVFQRLQLMKFVMPQPR